MSILIKGMEMPRNCWECKFSSEYDVVNGTALGCLITMKTKEKDLKPIPDWCPLIEVPEHHGRLIDADALMEDGWKLHKDVMRMGGFAIHEKPLNYPDIPTIIPADKDGEI